MKFKASPADVLGDIYGFKTINKLRSNAHITGVAHKGTGVIAIPQVTNVGGFVLTTLHTGTVIERNLVSEM